MTFFLPSAIDFDTIEQHYPPKFKPYKRDKLAYLLHKIATVSITNKNIVAVDGFVPLYAPALQNIVTNYRDYLQYAANAGIITINDSYQVGKSSKTYRFTSMYRTELIPYFPKYFKLIASLKKYRRATAKTVANTKYLTKWFNKKLAIDHKKVVSFLDEEWQLKMDNEDLWDYDASRKIFKNPFEQLQASKISSSYLNTGEYNLKIDANVNRFHSNLTNMRSLVRNAVTYDGQKLVSIDIKNSQPYFSILLLQSTFWKKSKKFQNRGFDDFSLNSLQKNVPQIPLSLDYNFNLYFKDINKRIKGNTIMLGETMASLIDKGLNDDKERFVSMAVAGTLYEFLTMQFRFIPGYENADRKMAKIAVLQTLFSDNRFIGTDEAKPKMCFKNVFPSVYKVFAAIKKKDKIVLALLLQNIESHFIINVITKRIAKENPELPIFTIHDSIVTTVGNEDYVAGIMKDELAKGVGIAPSLKYEYWEIETIDQYLIDLKIKAGILSA